ncbi:unnamed protein product [Bursaphelenchus xylophilus]|uniref:(pine wood nematode) hypothetical protein n=1 Tax=Bursaphelenchus xylophilus TaxID=6326 RepID=A0A1I7RWP5_BURXY|nr:unnamed protein product [Bursaphelenchus xylophilus]CAG9128545.1 unnamed protein product [Bursaphelenchus xylophilus]
MSIFSVFVWNIAVILLGKADEINSKYKDKNLDNDHLEYPLFAPFDSSPFVDPIRGLSPTQHAYFRSKFSSAYYDPVCAKHVYHVRPIYFNPGDTVRLKCVVCVRAEVFTGEMKHWKVLRRNVYDAVKNPRRVSDDDWVVLSDDTKKEFLGNQEDFKTPKFFDAEGNQTDVPKSEVYQNHGHLYITYARIEQFGLYECSDFSHIHAHQFAYLLIPRTPFLQPYENIFAEECNAEEGQQLSAARGRFDSFGLWRTFPMFLQNKEEGICAGNCLDTAPDESQFNSSWSVPIFTGDIDEEFLTKKLNLEVFLHWSPWSACSPALKMQTRTGHCHIRKVEERDFDFAKDSSTGVMKWIYPVHKLLETVTQFRKEGILLQSAILSDLMLESSSIPNHCSTYKNKILNEFVDGIVEKIRVKGVQTTPRESYFLDLNPCFRRLQDDDADPTRLLIMGHSICHGNRERIPTFLFHPSKNSLSFNSVPLYFRLPNLDLSICMVIPEPLRGCAFSTKASKRKDFTVSAVRAPIAQFLGTSNVGQFFDDFHLLQPHF